MFEFYQRYFDTVELNNSFYRLPTPEAFAAWRDAAPSNFIFAVWPDWNSLLRTMSGRIFDPQSNPQNRGLTRLAHT